MTSFDENKKLILTLLEQATFDTVITCPECDMNIEPDREDCNCGWENLLRKYGYI